jgi:hypothetical protein
VAARACSVSAIWLKRAAAQGFVEPIEAELGTNIEFNDRETRALNELRERHWVLRSMKVRAALGSAVPSVTLVLPAPGAQGNIRTVRHEVEDAAGYERDGAVRFAHAENRCVQLCIM